MVLVTNSNDLVAVLFQVKTSDKVVVEINDTGTNDILKENTNMDGYIDWFLVQATP